MSKAMDDDIRNVIDEAVEQSTRIPIPRRNSQICITYKDLTSPRGRTGFADMLIVFSSLFNSLMLILVLLKLFGLI